MAALKAYELSSDARELWVVPAGRCRALARDPKSGCYAYFMGEGSVLCPPAYPFAEDYGQACEQAERAVAYGVIPEKWLELPDRIGSPQSKWAEAHGLVFLWLLLTRRDVLRAEELASDLFSTLQGKMWQDEARPNSAPYWLWMQEQMIGGVEDPYTAVRLSGQAVDGVGGRAARRELVQLNVEPLRLYDPSGADLRGLLLRKPVWQGDSGLWHLDAIGVEELREPQRATQTERTGEP